MFIGASPTSPNRFVKKVYRRGDPFLAFFARRVPGVVRHDAIISSIGGYFSNGEKDCPNSSY
jgi:hypothetical protein